jgi:hypothetical protein
VLIQLPSRNTRKQTKRSSSSFQQQHRTAVRRGHREDAAESFYDRAMGRILFDLTHGCVVGIADHQASQGWRSWRVSSDLPRPIERISWLELIGTAATLPMEKPQMKLFVTLNQD